MIKTVKELKKVLDFAWALSQDELYASYHRLKTKEKVKDYIERAILSDSDRIIACYDQEILSGVSIYFGKPDENYAQTTMFLIKGDYDKIADEMIGHMAKEFPSCDLLIGFPFSNKMAETYFTKRNYPCVDALLDCRINHLQAHDNPKSDVLEEITKENFKDYVDFHDRFALPLQMYYNSHKLEKDLKRFRIFVFKDHGQIQASIFYVKGNISEIYGLFIDEAYKHKGIESILIDEVLMQLYKECGCVENLAYFIEEDSTVELDAALAVGFNIVDTYRCYKCKL